LITHGAGQGFVYSLTYKGKNLAQDSSVFICVFLLEEHAKRC
jgi:hypothetical protein